MTRIIAVILFAALSSFTFGQSEKLAVIAYYSGGPETTDSLAIEKLTHIIFSFCHLKGNKLAVDNKRDSLTLKRLVTLKTRNRDLKVILSLGGWGGCPSCSEVFATAANRKEFSESVLALNRSFKTDGLDLDWEYPTIEGYPGHRFVPEDKNNFTALVKQLRETLGAKYEISFAAGGFQKFLDESVDWKAVMPLVDKVNIMSYDLINGYATTTGHHTALYSRKEQAESTDNAVQYLIKLGIPRNKLVIGTAFYGRMWENVPAENNGLYQPGKFKTSMGFNRFATELNEANGFSYYWDDVTKAPYLYNAAKQLFVTYDDKRSIAIKTQYAIDQKLGGIMFWEITHDPYRDGLLHTIDSVKRKAATH